MKKIGIDLDLGVASLYAFRGLNLFKQAGQNDANALFAPAITWTIGETGFSVGYLGAYQWTGSNRSALVDAGIGHEQDLVAADTRVFSDKDSRAGVPVAGSGARKHGRIISQKS